MFTGIIHRHEKIISPSQTAFILAIQFNFDQHECDNILRVKGELGSFFYVLQSTKIEHHVSNAGLLL
jgi:hypothetical protein